MKGFRLIIRGQVQGVFFRHHTKKEADILGLKGYVRNMANGSVEIVMLTDKENTQRLIEWCNEGSPSSTVNSVDLDEIDIDENFDRFEIR